MSKIDVGILGTPRISVDSNPIKITSKKIQALFFYIFLNGNVTRNELVLMFWPDKGDETGRKNLRNTLYKLKKILGEDIILTEGNESIRINQDVVAKDSKALIHDKSIGGAYKGELLKGIDLKGNDEFAQWIFNERQGYKDRYRDATIKLIDTLDPVLNFAEIEKYIKDIIMVDEYNEKAYYMLMKLYNENKSHLKAIETYERLCEFLNRELGIFPNQEISSLYDSISEAINSNRATVDLEEAEDFYGRNEEIEVLKRNYDSFMAEMDFKSTMIIGEAGIGKTKLKKHFVEKHVAKGTDVIEVECHQIDESFYLKPWNKMMMKIKELIRIRNIQIPNSWRVAIGSVFPGFTDFENAEAKNAENFNELNFQYIEEIIIQIIKKMSFENKFIFIFEDIQWMDSISLRILEKVLLDNNRNLLFMGTMRNVSSEKVDEFFSVLSRYNILEKILIRRYTKKETLEFVNKLYPGISLTSTMLSRIYDETEGNTFFLSEFLDAIKEEREIGIMTSKMKDIVKSRFYGMSKESMAILNASSILFDKIDLNILEAITGKDMMEILDIMEELKNKFIIMEVDETNYMFTHQKIRDFIYESQPGKMRKILHGKTAVSIESGLSLSESDSHYYPRLIYHFSNAENKIKVLEYKIKYLKNFLDFEHELYPIVNDRFEKSDLVLSAEDAFKHFEEIRGLIDYFDSKRRDDDVYIGMKVEYLYMIGRFYIREGLYTKGTDRINELLETARDYGKSKYIILAKKQIVYASIQTHDTYMMDQSIRFIFENMDQDINPGEIAILYRLKAMSFIMKGDYQRAESDLKTSLNYFRKERSNRYALNMAASYNYMGDIRRYNMNFKSALKYYEKAIEICEKGKFIKGIAVFNSNAGQCAYELGDYENAFEYIKNAIDIYRKYNMIWNSSKAYSYGALILFKRHQYKNSLEYLMLADKIAVKLKNPYDIGLVYKVKAGIRLMMESDQESKNTFSEYLDMKPENYCCEGLKHFSGIRNCYEREFLKQIIARRKAGS